MRPQASLVGLGILVVALAACQGALAACQGGSGAGRGADGRPRDPASPAGSGGGASGSADPAGGDSSGMSSLGRAGEERYFRIDTLITQWDAAQSSGQDEQASMLAAKIGEETDADFPLIAASAAGRYGLRAQHLAVKSLGFSKNPTATGLLVARLNDPDPQLVANALIGLKLRSDPRTLLPPIIILLRSDAIEIRRYAPLALANVVLARERAGRPIEPALAADAMTGLVGLVQDRDPFVRLHAAKAMGALRLPEANDYLVLLLRDEHEKIRIAAAVGLVRIGDPQTLPQLVLLLDDVGVNQQPIVRDLLAAFAERLQGAPLTPEQVTALGTSPRAWGRWFSELRARQAAPRAPGSGSPGPAPRSGAPSPSAGSPPPPPPPTPLPVPSAPLPAPRAVPQR